MDGLASSRRFIGLRAERSPQSLNGVGRDMFYLTVIADPVALTRWDETAAEAPLRCTSEISHSSYKRLIRALQRCVLIDFRRERGSSIARRKRQVVVNGLASSRRYIGLRAERSPHPSNRVGHDMFYLTVLTDPVALTAFSAIF